MLQHQNVEIYPPTLDSRTSTRTSEIYAAILRPMRYLMRGGPSDASSADAARLDQACVQGFSLKASCSQAFGGNPCSFHFQFHFLFHYPYMTLYNPHITNIYIYIYRPNITLHNPGTLVSYCGKVIEARYTSDIDGVEVY